MLLSVLLCSCVCWLVGWCCCTVGWLGLLRCVSLCSWLWHAENPPCVHPKRLRVYVQNVCFNVRVVSAFTGTFWMYTRRRFGWTHGGEREVDGVVASSAYLNLPTECFTCPRGSPKKPLDLTHFKFENKSNTARPRFLQSFVLPQHTVELQLSQRKLRRESAVRWFDLSFAYILKYKE